MYSNNVFYNPYQNQNYEIPYYIDGNGIQFYQNTLGEVYFYGTEDQMIFCAADNSYYYKDENGICFIIDEAGLKTYFLPNGFQFHKDEFNKLYFFSPSGQQVFFHFDNYFNVHPFCEPSHVVENQKNEKSLQTKWDFNAIEEIKDKKILFDIRIKNKKIKTKLLSSHAILNYRVKEINDTFLKFSSWNILYKCNAFPNEKNSFNNPWRIRENKREYDLRLYEILKKILTIIKSEKNLSCFLLQEVMYDSKKSIIDLFIKKLNQMGWEALFSLDPNNKNDNCILYNQSRLKLIEKQSSMLKKGTKVHSVLQAVFYDNINKKEIILGSIHFNLKITKSSIKILMKDFKESRNLDSLLVWAGVINKQTASLSFGNSNYFSTLGNDGVGLFRNEKVLISPPQYKKIIFEELPFLSFVKKNSFNLTSKKIDEIIFSYEEDNSKHVIYIKSLTSIIASKTNQKLFINYKKNNYVIFSKDNESYEKLSQIIPIEKTRIIFFEETLKKIQIDSKQLTQVLTKFMDPDYFTFLLDYNFEYYTTNPKPKLLDPYVPHRKINKFKSKLID